MGDIVETMWHIGIANVLSLTKSLCGPWPMSIPKRTANRK
jgi:hypothetical protein